MRKGEADGGRGLRLEGDITVVAGKSGGKWEIQRPGDKWLITTRERERESVARSACLVLRGRRQGMGRIHRGHWTGTRNCMDAKLGTVMYADAGPDVVPITLSHVQHCVHVSFARWLRACQFYQFHTPTSKNSSCDELKLKILCEFILNKWLNYTWWKKILKIFFIRKNYNSIVWELIFLYRNVLIRLQNA